jgi:hypothetical protein
MSLGGEEEADVLEGQVRRLPSGAYCRFAHGPFRTGAFRRDLVSMSQKQSVLKMVNRSAFRVIADHDVPSLDQAYSSLIPPQAEQVLDLLYAYFVFATRIERSSWITSLARRVVVLQGCRSKMNLTLPRQSSH